MTRLEFFKLAMRSKCYARKSWVVSAFAIINESPDAYLADPYPCRVVQTQTSISYVDPESKVLVPITDWKRGEPLFKFSDRLIVDSTFCENAVTPVETTVGNVLVNLISLVNSFGKKIPFMTGVFNIQKVEDIIAETLTGAPESGEERFPNVFYVDEYIKFVDSLSYIAGFGFLSVHAATEKSMTVAKDFLSFKEKTIKKYEGKLGDPVEMAAFEKELQDFDEKHLQGDPSNGKFLSGKTKNIARKKLFLTMGGEPGFTDGLILTPIPNSLEEGWSRDPEQYVAMMNGLRNGSYSRAIETIKGGTTNKVFLRSGSNFKIIPEDCGTQLGINRFITSNNYKSLVGRMILTGSQWRFIEKEDEAKKQIDIVTTTRSPMFCLHEGDRICEFCAGKRLSSNPYVLSVGLVEVSSIIMTTALKMMHGKVLAATKLDIQRIFS